MLSFKTFTIFHSRLKRHDIFEKKPYDVSQYFNFQACETPALSNFSSC